MSLLFISSLVLTFVHQLYVKFYFVSFMLYRDSQDSHNTVLELSSVQRTLLDAIIKTQFSEASILHFLRSTLNLPNCLTVLQYIAQSLPQTRNITHVQALLRWAAVLLDSHYQQLLLSKDECVSSTVTALKELVESQVLS